MTRSRRPSVRLLAGLLSVLAIVAGAAPVAARTPIRPAGIDPFTVLLSVNACRIDVYGIPVIPVMSPDVTIRVKRGSATTYKQTLKATGDQLIQVSTCPTLLRPGDTIKLSANGQSRLLTVPRLTSRILPASKRLIGTVPVGGRLQANLWNCQLFADGSCTGIFNGDVPTHPSTEAWSVDLGAHGDWKPGFTDYLMIDWSPTPDGDHFYLNQAVEHAIIQVGSAVVTGAAVFGTTAKLTLEGPGGAVRGTATAKASGITGVWKATLRDTKGATVKVRVGDTLRTNLLKTKKTKPGASIKAVDLQVTVLTDGSTQVNGNARCAPGRRIAVVMHGDPGSGVYYKEGIANGDGRISFAESFNVPVGWVVDAHCPSARFLDHLAVDTAVAP